MFTGFQHSIAGGQGNLIATSLKSPNFVHNVSGWQVTKSGNVEFNNGTFRGTITGGVFQGTDFVINSSGAFFYAAAPALGNLIASVTPAAGSNDGEGNHYLAGLASYQQSSNSAVSLGGFEIVWWNNTGAGTIWTPGQGIIQATSPGFGLAVSGLGFWDFLGTPILGGMVASAPSDVTGATPETWHPITLANGWANAGGGLYACQYRLMPDNSVWLIGVINSAAMTNATFFTLPLVYRPLNTGGDYPVSFHTGTGYTQGAFLRVTTAGVCGILNATTATGAVVINCRIPLDNI